MLVMACWRLNVSASPEGKTGPATALLPSSASSWVAPHPGFTAKAGPNRAISLYRQTRPGWPVPPSLEAIFTRATLGVHHAYSIRTPSVQYPYTMRTPCVHDPYTIRTPSVHHVNRLATPV